MIILNFELLEDFEVGSTLMANLAFPDPNESEARAAAAEALCARFFRAAIKVCDPEYAGIWRRTFPRFEAISEADERRRLRTLRRRLSDSMLAARMSLGFFEEGIRNAKITLPPGMTRLSLDQLSAQVNDGSDDRETNENIEHRIWRASRPVIHLAAAFQLLLRVHPEFRNRQDGQYPLDDGDLHRKVIDLAELHEPLVRADRRFSRRLIQLIQLRYRN